MNDRVGFTVHTDRSLVMPFSMRQPFPIQVRLGHLPEGQVTGQARAITGLALEERRKSVGKRSEGILRSVGLLRRGGDRKEGRWELIE